MIRVIIQMIRVIIQMIRFRMMRILKTLIYISTLPRYCRTYLNQGYVCLFMWRHSLLTRVKGHQKLRIPACLWQRSSGRGEGTLTKPGWSCPGGSLLSPSASTAQLTREALQPQSLKCQITFDAALRHCNGNEYRGLWRDMSSCQWYNRGTSNK